MPILRKSLDIITITDLEQLIAQEARETGELEFKGTLPFRSERGSTAVADRWTEKGDRIGDYACDQLLAELVAFANADGGTLILGLHETKEEPRRALWLDPLRDCESLARRLLDVAEDVVEPRLPFVVVKALPVDDRGSGYVIMRVGKSLFGPHRLNSTREFYIRRGERAARMTVREIKDLTLELARTGDRIELLFEERHAAARAQFEPLFEQERAKGGSPLLLRVTAVPTTPQRIPSLTSRRDLWWIGQSFSVKVGDQNYECEYPACDFGDYPRVRLRSLASDSDRTYGGPERLLRDDGTVEFRLLHLAREPIGQEPRNYTNVYVSWIIGLAVGTLSQISRLRRRLAWDSIEYGLEIEIWCGQSLVLKWRDHASAVGAIENATPLRLPRYSVHTGDTFNDLISEIVQDISNAWGREWTHPCQIPWDLVSTS